MVYATCYVVMTLGSSIEKELSYESLVGQGFSADVVKMFIKHSGRLVEMGAELDKKDALKKEKVRLTLGYAS